MTVRGTVPPLNDLLSLLARGGGGEIKARLHPDRRSNIVRVKEENRERRLISAQFCRVTLHMPLLQCLYSALVAMCDYWIHLCEYKLLLCLPVVCERGETEGELLQEAGKMSDGTFKIKACAAKCEPVTR